MHIFYFIIHFFIFGHSSFCSPVTFVPSKVPLSNALPCSQVMEVNSEAPTATYCGHLTPSKKRLWTTRGYGRRILKPPLPPGSNPPPPPYPVPMRCGRCGPCPAQGSSPCLPPLIFRPCPTTVPLCPCRSVCERQGAVFWFGLVLYLNQTIQSSMGKAKKRSISQSILSQFHRKLEIGNWFC